MGRDWTYPWLRNKKLLYMRRGTTMTNNKKVLAWIDEMAKMTKPDKIVWIDGTEEQAEALRAEACSTGEMIKLNQELLPNCYLHRTAEIGRAHV